MRLLRIGRPELSPIYHPAAGIYRQSSGGCVRNSALFFLHGSIRLRRTELARIVRLGVTICAPQVGPWRLPTMRWMGGE